MVKKRVDTQRDPLLAFREEFPILANTNYLVSNSLGPMPRAVPEKLDRKSTRLNSSH